MAAAAAAAAAAQNYTLTEANIQTLESADGSYNFHIQDMNKDAFASPNIKTIRTYTTITKSEAGIKTYIAALLRNRFKSGGFYTHKLIKGGAKTIKDLINELKTYKPNIKIKEVKRGGTSYYEVTLLNDKKLIENRLYETCLNTLFQDKYVIEATGNLHQIEQMEEDIEAAPPPNVISVNINSLYSYPLNNETWIYVPYEIEYMIRDSGSTYYARAPDVPGRGFPRNNAAAIQGPRGQGDQQSLTFLFVHSDATDPAPRQNFRGDQNARFFPPGNEILRIDNTVLPKLGCKQDVITGYNIRRNGNQYIVGYTITCRGGETQIEMRVSCADMGYVRSGNGSQFFTGNPEKNSWFAANHNKVTPANVRAGIAYLVSKEFWGDCHIVEVAKLYQLRGNRDAAIFTDDNALTAFALKNEVNCVTKQRDGGNIKSVLRYHTGPIAGGGDGISPNLEKSSMKYNYYSFIVINNNHKVIELIETLPEKDRDPLLIEKIKKLSIWVGSQTDEERIKDCSVINMVIDGKQSGYITNPFQFVPEDIVREIDGQTLAQFQGPPYETYGELIGRYSIIETRSTKSVQAIYDPKPVTTTSLLMDIIKEYYVDEDAKHQDKLQLEIDDIYNYLYYIFSTLGTVTLVPNKVYLIMHDIIKDKKIQSMNKDSLVNYYNGIVKAHSGSRKRIRFGQTQRRHKRTTQRRSGRRYTHTQTRRQSRSRSLQVSPPKQSGQPRGSPGSLQASPIKNNGFFPISNTLPVGSSPNASPGSTESAPPPSAPQSQSQSLRTVGFRPTQGSRGQGLSPVPERSQATN